MEDSSGFGYPLAPIGKYKCLKQDEPSMMLWALIGAIVGCKDLYQAITKKNNSFDKDGWEGHALTQLFKSDDHPSICIVPNLEEATEDMLKEKDVIIVVDTDEDTVSNTMEKVRDNDGRWDDGYGST